MSRPVYMGDLSKRDAALLAKYAAKATSVLEFGVGASTQILAQCCPEQTPILSVDTDQGWIDRTKQNFKDLELPDRVAYVLYEAFKGNAHQPDFDLIFDDGASNLRLDFALFAWPFLQVGGVLLVHDTRKWHINQVAELLTKHPDTIQSIKVNEGESNITVVQKRTPLPYRNWNVDEKKEPWEFTVWDRPKDWLERLRKRFADRRVT